MKKILTGLTLWVVFLFPSYSQNNPAWQQKVTSTLLDKTRDGQSVPFLVLLTEQADVSGADRLETKVAKATYVFQQLKHTADGSQQEIKTFLEEHQIPFESLFIVNAIRTEGNADLIRQLALRKDVRRLLDNPALRFPEPAEWSAPSPAEPRGQIEWGIDKINADEVWALGFRGQGVVVGGEDTGYDWTHPALKKKYRGYDEVHDTTDHNYHWHDAIHTTSPLNSDTLNPCGFNTLAPCDDNSHGTHTMGTMIGSDGENEIGVAPEAKWCGCRNMERGWGSPFTYLECFQWFLAPTDLSNQHPDPAMAPHVINNSWGCPNIEGCDTSNFELLRIAVDNLRMAGTVVVVSAGNDGSGCSSVATPAAIYDGSFSVGATAINDTIAGFSSRGPVTVDGSNRLKPNVSAPGVGVRSARPGGQYGFASGTSMAGPHVAGAVALIISANPALAGKVEIIEHILEQTAVPRTTDQECGGIPGTEIPNNTYGYGRIDVLAAVQAAIALIGTGTQDVAAENYFHLYPNPVTDQLIVESPEDAGSVTFEWYDVQGTLRQHQVIRFEGQRKHTIDVSSSMTGLYVYRIISGNRLQTGKLIKN